MQLERQNNLFIRLLNIGDFNQSSNEENLINIENMIIALEISKLKIVYIKKDNIWRFEHAIIDGVKTCDKYGIKNCWCNKSS